MKKTLILFFIIIGFFLALIYLQFTGPKKKSGIETFVINLITPEEKVIQRLKEEGFIRHEFTFRLVLVVRGWRGKIQPGGYKISKSMKVWEIADILVNHPYQKWVVIPEGLRKEEVVERVAQVLNWKEKEKKEFLKTAKEGYLFPDTYLLNLDYSGEQVAKRMESRFNEMVADLFKEAREKNIRNDTLIILASLVQREAANDAEMPLIAGIIWNRLLKGMKLEIDATVQYALGREGNWWPKIKPEDYKIDSPYNTYLYKGKPPTPICNPGISAIKAVLEPKETEYLYYLHDEKGNIHLAKTYEEHLLNIEKYLKGK
jgi:UPF0755 protein